MIPTSCASILLLAYRCDVDFCTKQNVLKRRSRLHKLNTKHPTRAKCRGVCGLPSVTVAKPDTEGSGFFRPSELPVPAAFLYFSKKGTNVKKRTYVQIEFSSVKENFFSYSRKNNSNE